MAKCDNCKELEVKNIWGKVPFEWCEKKNDNPDKNIERDCPYFKPKTNADRIRSMSNEELAKFLFNVNSAYAEPCMTGEYGHTCKWEDYPTHDKGCKDCFLEWLKSEVGCE